MNPSHPSRSPFESAQFPVTLGGGNTQVRARLAPTPSGFLHPGNAFSFVLTWLLVRAQKGTLLLRIDDLDATRTRTEYIDDLFVSLDWLGLDYDEGPSGPADFQQHWSQRHRLGLYEQALQRLAQAEQLFACRCSRKQLQEQAADGRYPGTCAGLKRPLEQADVAWRLRLTPPDGLRLDLTGAEEERWVQQHMPCTILRRREGLPAYQLASVVDDVHFGVNLMVRGEDLLSSSTFQRMLARRLAFVGVEGMETFGSSVFLHHPLLYEDPTRKVSKSHDDLSLLQLRRVWPTSAPLLKWVGEILGLPAFDGSLAGLRAAFEGTVQGQGLHLGLSWPAETRLPMLTTSSQD